MSGSSVGSPPSSLPPSLSLPSRAQVSADPPQTPTPAPAELARTKGRAIFGAGCLVSEFGSRRRRTYRAHDVALRGLVAADREAAAAAAAGQGEGEGKGKRGRLAGTSNVHFACKYDLVPIGTARLPLPLSPSLSLPLFCLSLPLSRAAQHPT